MRILIALGADTAFTIPVALTSDPFGVFPVTRESISLCLLRILALGMVMEWFSLTMMGDSERVTFSRRGRVLRDLGRDESF
jgi:hypothetical protein